jgi:drug/metabolite transporter (DMT)-like permease
MKVIVLWQCVSLVYTAAALLADQYLAHIPATATLSVYIALLLATSSYTYTSSTSTSSIAAADTIATCLNITAYAYTSIVSAQVIDCANIPTVIIITYLIYNTHYKHTQITAATIATSGIVITAVADQNYSSSLGDIIVLAAAILTAISSILQDNIVKHQHDPLDIYRLSLGLCNQIARWGTVFATLQLVYTGELATILQTNTIQSSLLMPLLAFALLKSIFYIAVPILLYQSNAATMSISLLSSDVYTFIAATVWMDFQCNALYVFGMVMAMSGILLFYCDNLEFILRPARRIKSWIENIFKRTQPAPTSNLELNSIQESHVAFTVEEPAEPEAG